MPDKFEITVSWLPPCLGSPEISETYAEIGLRINAHEATRVEDKLARSVRRSVRVSAYLLARWFAANWWRLRWEPEKKHLTGSDQAIDWRMSHHVPAVGGGYVWPPLTFVSDGFHIAAHFQGSLESEDGAKYPIKYLGDFIEFLEPSQFEFGLSQFIEVVLARLEISAIRNTELHLLWSDICTERSRSGPSETRKVEALLGIDPEDDDELIERLLPWQKKIGKNALEEFAASSPSSQIDAMLEKSAKADKSVKTFGRIANFHEIRTALASTPVPLSEVPAKSGKQIAQLMRNAWELGRRPITNSKLADLLNLKETALLEASSDVFLPMAVRGKQEDQIKLIMRPGRPDHRRFEICRMVGDHSALEFHDTWRPATTSMTARQKFQRSFAAEFLCPSDELVERCQGRPLLIDEVEETVDKMAEEYQVSSYVVMNHLRLRGLLEEPSLRSM